MKIQYEDKTITFQPHWGSIEDIEKSRTITVWILYKHKKRKFSQKKILYEQYNDPLTRPSRWISYHQCFEQNYEDKINPSQD